MDGPRDVHTKWTKSEKERRIPYDIVHMRALKYGTNELIYETERQQHETETVSQTQETRLVAAKGEEGEGEMDWELGLVPVKVAQSCPTLCDPMDYPAHGISRPECWNG